jgi:hypothetical protein
MLQRLTMTIATTIIATIAGAIPKTPSKRRTRITAGALVLGLAMLANLASAEVQRFESVGAVPIDLDARETIAPRDAAIDRAILGAVERVANELLEAEKERQRILASTLPPQPETTDSPLDPNAGEKPVAVDAPDIEALLGKKMALYASRYRVLEDRGEGPAIFTSDPDATTEYVVVVEVFVDAARVRRQLIKDGLLPVGGPGVAAGRIRIEVEGLAAYPGYVALRELLQEEYGAITVVPVEMEKGRTVFEVESPDEPQALLEKLLGHDRPGIEIVPLVPEDSDLRLAVHWTPLLPEIDDESSPAASGEGSNHDGERHPDSRDSDNPDARRSQNAPGN